MLLRNRLRELRGERSQKQLIDEFEKATEIRLKQNSYSNWENGREPSLEMLVKLADFHGVTMDYLVGRVDYIQPEYRQVNIDTGLTEAAIHGVQAIRDTSTDENNRIKALNYLLENDWNTKFSCLLEMIARYDLYSDYEELESIDCSVEKRKMIRNLIEEHISSAEAMKLKEMLEVWRKEFQDDYDMPF